MNIYSIPPLLSAIILLILFLMGIFKAKNAHINLLFSLICIIGCMLNIDKTLLTIVQDEALAIRISRIDHIFLVFIIPLYLHFTILATGHKGWMPLVKIFYIIAFFLIPLTQHPLYLTGVIRYYFGFFAASGSLFYVFGTFCTLSVVLSLYLLFKNLKEEKVSIKKTRIKYIILSFGLAAFVNHFDVAVMGGYEAYPIGNFIFVPMCLLGYAIYRHDVMEWKIFLNKGIVFVTLLLISIGFFIGLEVLLKNLFRNSLNTDLISLTAMIFTFLLIYISKERVQYFLIQFLQQEFIKNRKAIKDLSFEILTLYSVGKIKKTIIERLSNTFTLERCNIMMVPRTEESEVFRFIHEADELWKQGYRLSLPVPSKLHPAYLLLGEKGDMSLYTGEETEILSILANHIALALDNAASYKKIQDFSNSLEKLVDERTKALIQSESLAAVGRLAAGIAHELNNPIAGVMSTLEYYIDHLEGQNELLDDLTFSLNELKRTKEIIKSLLEASRQKDEVKELVEIHAPIEDTLRILHNQYKLKKISINKKFNATSSIIKGNSARLCQVFINIIKNAIDAIGDENGVITIETLNKDESQLVCKVTDSGAGIEKHVLKDIFKPFFTTKQQGKGIGLGLFIVHEIIKDHEGSIEVESNKTTGTTFTFIFPCHR
ncbi:MAG: ATP-binding protein [Proteobacteria bacterium]|nr:ATP-binding protein [Pseudomonadota bacterium]